MFITYCTSKTYKLVHQVVTVHNFNQIRIMEKKGTQILVVSEENLSVSEEEKVRSKDNRASKG